MKNKISMIVFVVLIMAACGDECKDLNLSASDQSFVDMMKHYLHTSRSEKCQSNENPSIDAHNIGVTYVRWGKKSCPDSADLVYTGQVGGTSHNIKGRGVNYLCLTSDPGNGETLSYVNGVLFGVEYEMPSGWSSELLNKEVTCSVCRRKGKTSVLVITGGQTCYRNWHLEYRGYLMTDHMEHNKKTLHALIGQPNH